MLLTFTKLGKIRTAGPGNKHAVGEFLAEFLETGVGAGPVQLGDDISDGLADAGDFGEPLLLDQAVEGFGECSEAVRCAGIGLGSVIRIAAAQRCRWAYSRSNLATCGALAFDILSFRWSCFRFTAYTCA